MTLHWNWPIRGAKIGRNTYLIGQFQHIVMFYGRILFIESGSGHPTLYFPYIEIYETSYNIDFCPKNAQKLQNSQKLGYCCHNTVSTVPFSLQLYLFLKLSHVWKWSFIQYKLSIKENSIGVSIRHLLATWVLPIKPNSTFFLQLSFRPSRFRYV